MGIVSFFHPEAYQGSRRRRRYFEGWYCKAVGADRREVWSFILGLSRTGEGGASSFLQVIEGRSARTWWFEHPLADFQASTRRLEVAVGATVLSSSGLVLAEGPFQGRLAFGPLANLRPSLGAPGIMGPFSYVPAMECRHGLISLDHGLSGRLGLEGREVDFGGGRGYLEKDWGSSMPSAWLWTQSNHLGAKGNSFMCSLARIPWLGSAFPGFLFAARLEGVFLREATYTGARVGLVKVDDGVVHLVIRGRRDHLELRAERSRGGLLRAPQAGAMERRIAESVDARVDLSWRRDGRLEFEGRADPAGLEVVGSLESLGLGGA